MELLQVFSGLTKKTLIELADLTSHLFLLKILILPGAWKYMAGRITSNSKQSNMLTLKPQLVSLTNSETGICWRIRGWRLNFSQVDIEKRQIVITIILGDKSASLYTYMYKESKCKGNVEPFTYYAQ